MRNSRSLQRNNFFVLHVRRELTSFCTCDIPVSVTSRRRLFFSLRDKCQRSEKGRRKGFQIGLVQN